MPTNVAGDPANPTSSAHPAHPGPLFLATAGGRITGAVQVGGTGVVLAPDPPFGDGFSGFARADGNPPRFLIGRQIDQVKLDTNDGNLRTANNVGRFRWTDAGIGFFGAAPAAQPGNGYNMAAAPAAYDQVYIDSLRVLVNHLRFVLRTLGLVVP
jgi:hypothetical protein